MLNLRQNQAANQKEKERGDKDIHAVTKAHTLKTACVFTKGLLNHIIL